MNPAKKQIQQSPPPTQAKFSVAQAEKLLDLSPSEWRVYRTIKKHQLTKGQSAIPISCSLLAKLSKLDIRNAARAIRKLIQKQIILKKTARWKEGIITYYSINPRTNQWQGKRKPEKTIIFNARLPHALKAIMRWTQDTELTCKDIALFYNSTTGSRLSPYEIGALLNKIGLNTTKFTSGNRGITKAKAKRFLKLKLIKGYKKSPPQTHTEQDRRTTHQKVTVIYKYILNNYKERNELVHIQRGLAFLKPGGQAYKAVITRINKLKTDNQKAGP